MKRQVDVISSGEKDHARKRRKKSNTLDLLLSCENNEERLSTEIFLGNLMNRYKIQNPVKALLQLRNELHSFFVPLDSHTLPKTFQLSILNSENSVKEEQEGPFQNLPNEIIKHILYYACLTGSLSWTSSHFQETVLSLIAVNKKWREIICAFSHWRSLVVQPPKITKKVVRHCRDFKLHILPLFSSEELAFISEVPYFHENHWEYHSRLSDLICDVSVFSNLKKLTLINFEPDVCLSGLNIKDLHIAGRQLEKSWLNSLNYITNLESLKLEMRFVDFENHLQQLSLPNLSKLEITCMESNETPFPMIDCPKLQFLNIYTLIQADFAVISKLTDLTYLGSLEFPDSEINTFGLSELVKLDTLGISCIGGLLQESDFSVFEKISSLKTVYLPEKRKMEYEPFLGKFHELEIEVMWWDGKNILEGDFDENEIKLNCLSE